jgi:hypothetical protein
MPVFQFANDWRNWRYQPVRAANSSTPDSGTSLPVFSGYFWIYLGISAALMLFTVEAWWRFGRGEVKRRRDKYWTTHLIATILIYLIRLAILILFILIYFLLRVRRQHAKSLKDWTIRMARKIHSYLGMSVNFIRFVVAAGAKAIFDPIITSLQGCLQPSTQPNTETVPESDPQRPQQDLVGRPPSPPPRQSPPASPGTSSPQSQKQNDVTRSGDDMV